MTKRKHEPGWSSIIDLAGQRFEKLVVIGLDPMRRPRGGARWLCRCDCGHTRSIRADALRSGITVSCGCVGRQRRRTANTTHDQSDSGEFSSWRAMRQRCANPNHRAYPNYGGRGIRVCDRWERSFEAFLEDMGARPSAKHSIDRIDNAKGYEPGNCRWATATQQSWNSSKTTLIEFRGEKLSIREWARRVGISVSTLLQRLRSGWALERALTIRHPAIRPRIITANGIARTLAEWGRVTGLRRTTITQRLDAYGWSAERALGLAP